MALGGRYSIAEVDGEIDRQFAEGKYPISKDVVKMLARNENMERSGKVNFGNLKSSADARGVMQVIPSTLAGLKQQGYLPADFTDDLNSGSLSDQVKAGIAAVSEMSTRVKTTDAIELAALYHGGSGALTDYRAGNMSARPATANYVKNAKTIMADPTAASYAPVTPATVKPTATPPIANSEDAMSAYKTTFSAVLDAFNIRERGAQTEAVAQQGALQAGSAALQESTRLNAEAVIAEEQAHKQLLQITGLDIADPDSYIAQMFTKKAELGTARQDQRNKIDELESVSFLENPLAFIMNIPELKRTVAAHNRIVTEENTVDADLAKRLATANQLRPLTPAKSADILRAKAVADSQVIAADAASKLASSRENATAATAKTLHDTLNAHGNLLGQMRQADEAEARQLDREDKAFDRTIRRDLLQEKAAATKRGENLATSINIFRGMINGKNTRPYTAEDIREMPPQLKAEWSEVIERGNFGNNYAQSVPFINDKGNKVAAAEAGNSAMMTVAHNLAMRAQAEQGAIEADHRAQNVMAGKLPLKEVEARALMKIYNDDAKLAAKGIDKSSISTSDSPYKFDYNAVIATALTNPQAAENVVVRSLLTVKQLNPSGAVSDRTLFAAIEAEVVAKKLDPKIAGAQVAEFYRTMADNTYVVGGLKLFGLPKLEDYTITPGAAGDKQVDLMNATQVENYLMSRVRRSGEHPIDAWVGDRLDSINRGGDSVVDFLLGPKVEPKHGNKP